MHTYVGVGVVSNEAIPRTTIYGVSGMEGLLIDKPLTVLPKLGKGVIINFRQEDEKVLVKSGIPTISMQTLLSMCCGRAVDLDEMDCIFQCTAGIHYTNIFCNRQVDFSILYSSPRFWERIAKLVCEGMAILKRQGLWEDFKLEIRVTAVLHRMFDEGYSLDIKGVRRQYLELQGILSEVKGKIGKSCGDVSDLLHIRQKIEDKLRRIPREIYSVIGNEAVVYCNFRSIGTDTFRITTNHTNLQGLPKEIRRCLLPRHGDMLIEYDLVSSQVMILACLSGEDSLIQFYLHGEDLYLQIAAVLAGKQAKDITKAERGIYKLVILQMLYGAGISTLQKELAANGMKRSYTEVEEMQRRFYASFPAIKKYSDMVKMADSVTLLTGRKWNLKDSIESYKRLSYIMQYVEGVILREVLVLLNKEATSNELWLYLCIHDSVFVETNPSVYAKTQAIVRRCFNDAVGKYLPIITQTRIKEEVIYERKNDVRGVF